MQSDRLAPLYRIFLQFKEYYPIIIIYSICISVLTLATPISVQALVNTFSFGPFFQPIFILSILLLALLTVLVLITALQYLMVEYLQRRLYAKVTSSIGRAYFFGKGAEDPGIKRKGNRYFDVISIQKNIAFLVTDGVAVGLQTVLGLILISFYHPYFIILSILILICVLLPLYIYGNRGLNSAIEESTAKYQVAAFIEDLDQASHIPIPEEMIPQKVSELDQQVDGFIDKRIRHFRTVFTQKMMYLSMYAFLNSLLLGLGGFLVASHQLTIGQLVAAEIVVNAILSQFFYAHKYLEAFYDIYASSWKVYAFYKYIDDHKAQNSIEEKAKPFLYSRASWDFHRHIEAIRKIYSPQNYRSVLRDFFLAVLVLLTLLVITPWQQTSSGSGRVIAYDPNDRSQTITATVSGLIEEWLVQDGQLVKKGDPIVRIIDNDPDYLMRLEAKRDAALMKFDAARASSDTARLNFHRQEELMKEGLSSRKEYEAAKITYKKLQADEASTAVELANAEVTFSRQQLQVVTAPRDGQILSILHGSGTTLVSVGTPLVKFVPSTSDNIVEIYIEGNDLPLVYPGRKVRLQFEGWPSVQFSGFPSVAIGSFGGIVTTVDPFVSSDGMFRILVKPDPDDRVDWPDQTFLRQGSRALGLVVLDQVSLGYEIWRQVNGFPKSMPNPPSNVQMPMKGRGR
jgi:ABC-type multidrug transport system fused ATPase/permease subunit